jgi:predicted DNA-binding transcriptional regulator AlpA
LTEEKKALHGSRPKRGLAVLSVTDVVEITGVSRQTLYRWEQLGLLPKRRQIGPARVGYLQREIEAWLESRPPARAVAGISTEPATIKTSTITT